MFCTSLRRRKPYASILNSLTSSSTLGLRESDLKTHDIALPLSSTTNPATGTARSKRQLRILLLSPSSVSAEKLASSMERIRRFASLTGGQDLAIVFLLYAGDSISEEVSTAGMVAYAKLQAEMMDHGEMPSMPILPLPRLEGLSTLLKSHQTALERPRASQSKNAGVAPFELLRQCSTEPLMNESAAFLLTDLFPNLREVANACTTRSAPQPSSSESAGIDNANTTVFNDDGSFLANNTETTDEDSNKGKLRFFRELTDEEQHRDLLDFWTVEFAA